MSKKKKIFISAALLTVLATMTFSCQKEEFINQTDNAEVTAIRIVRYTINGRKYSETLYGESQWQEFVDRMVMLAHEGNEVSFINESATSACTAGKDVHVYKTTDENDANRWAREMADRGYNVTITYDNGTYICIAVRP